MMFERKCVGLLELYDNSRKEFFQELAAFLANVYPEVEHTILECGGENIWKMRATTLRDPDEIAFLVTMAKNEAVKKRNCFQFSISRKNIKGHLVIPLSIHGRKMIGIWIIENQWKEKVSADKEVLWFGKLLALVLQAASDEKNSMSNRYIDAGTGLLGKQYFSQVADRILQKKYKVVLCCIRWNGYRETVRMKGAAEAEEWILKLIRDVKCLELGNCYMLAEDTLSIISLESKQEVYARLEYLVDKPAAGSNLKVVMIDLEKQMDLFTYMEELFVLCNPGIIWMKDRNPMADLFVAESDHETGRNLKAEQETEDVVDELLGLLERKYTR